MGDEAGADWPPIQFTEAEDGSRVAFRYFEGTGPPFLIAQNPGVPGLSLTPLTIDREVIDRFRRGRGFMSFDWRGSGASDPIRGELSIDQLQLDLDAVIGVLGEPVDATVGGRATLAVALHAERRLERYRSIWFRAGVIRSGQGWIGRYNRPGWEQDYHEHLRGLAERFFPLDPEEASRFALLYERSVPARTFAAYLEAEQDIDLTEVLPAIDVPTWVTARTPIDHEGARRIALLLPDSHLSINPMTAESDFSDWGREQWDTWLGERLGDPHSIRAESVAGSRDEPVQTGTVTRPQRDGLSDRELEVLRLVAAGMRNAQIAEQLVIAPGTVARHVSNIFKKIGVTSRTEATRYAIRYGISE